VLAAKNVKKLSEKLFRSSQVLKVGYSPECIWPKKGISVIVSGTPFTRQSQDSIEKSDIR
jgi:hypothetical protein